ncbi:hypothetical protein TorRG33x02_105280 [Trema orientale]|uniref:Uncharacterized protein n=1 Tax=Trema orientale TaxID=63057 RepID=A0A2P5F6X4_TREOI|nr:hypothetical protein TorRG33x02_105280 [Trema orientale]
METKSHIGAEERVVVRESDKTQDATGESPPTSLLVGLSCVPHALHYSVGRRTPPSIVQFALQRGQAHSSKYSPMFRPNGPLHIKNESQSVIVRTDTMPVLFLSNGPYVVSYFYEPVAFCGFILLPDLFQPNAPFVLCTTQVGVVTSFNPS